jgi:DNA-binding transcriptional MerR regulator
MSDERYRIGELATLTGLTPDALRFYERQGVLDKPARTSGRFRVYSPLVVDRIRFIKKAQALGFTLSEIRELVQFNGKGGLRRCCRVRDLLRTRLNELEATLSELGVLRKTLRTTLRECETAIETENVSACPIIELTTDNRKDGVA